jgi:hypothetical protein
MKALELIYGSLFYYGLVICRLSKRIFLYSKSVFNYVTTRFNDQIQLLIGICLLCVIIYCMAWLIVWTASIFGIVGGL